MSLGCTEPGKHGEHWSATFVWRDTGLPRKAHTQYIYRVLLSPFLVLLHPAVRLVLTLLRCVREIFRRLSCILLACWGHACTTAN